MHAAYEDFPDFRGVNVVTMYFGHSKDEDPAYGRLLSLLLRDVCAFADTKADVQRVTAANKKALDTHWHVVIKARQRNNAFTLHAWIKKKFDIKSPKRGGIIESMIQQARSDAVMVPAPERTRQSRRLPPEQHREPAEEKKREKRKRLSQMQPKPVPPKRTEAERQRTSPKTVAAPPKIVAVPKPSPKPRKPVTPKPRTTRTTSPKRATRAPPDSPKRAIRAPPKPRAPRASSDSPKPRATRASPESPKLTAPTRSQPQEEVRQKPSSAKWEAPQREEKADVDPVERALGHAERILRFAREETRPYVPPSPYFPWPGLPPASCFPPPGFPYVFSPPLSPGFPSSWSGSGSHGPEVPQPEKGREKRQKASSTPTSPLAWCGPPPGPSVGSCWPSFPPSSPWACPPMPSSPFVPPSPPSPATPSASSFREWTIDDVSEQLLKAGLVVLVVPFRERFINGPGLLRLTTEDIIEMGFGRYTAVAFEQWRLQLTRA